MSGAMTIGWQAQREAQASSFGDTMSYAGAATHSVLFYESLPQLVEVTAGFARDGVRRGESVLILTTLGHRRAFEAELARDLDTTELGRVRYGDCRGYLARLCENGVPSRARFERAIGRWVAELASQGDGVRVYGEMVGLLWTRGRAEGALALESLWSDLQARLRFPLMCAYPAGAMARGGWLHIAEQVHGVHSAVLGECSPRREARREFPGAAASIAAVRAYSVEQAREWGFGAIAEPLALVTTELATNAFVHAGSRFIFAMTATGDALRVSVEDRSRFQPWSPRHGARDATGRGLLLIEMLSSGWGSERLSDGKIVWAELRA